LLKEKGITCLAHVGIDVQVGNTTTRWKKVGSLGLVGTQKDEWNYYIRGLVSVGIELNNENDKLLWSWDTKQRKVNAKLAYKAQLLEGGVVEPKFCFLRFGDDNYL